MLTSLDDDRLVRHCDSDCLHSKACDADYTDQLEELADEQKAAEQRLAERTVPVCGVVFEVGGRLGVLSLKCQLERDHLGDHIGTIIR